MTAYSEPTNPLAFTEVMASLPPDWADDTLTAKIRAASGADGVKAVVLDDDPTGPQAVSDVFELTEWTVEALRRELTEPRRLFFVLTNTRSMPTGVAVELNRQIAANLAVASRQTGIRYSLISRGDSTLRGHFPHEVEALGKCDTILLVPAFFEGGRYTIDDVQWVREGDLLLPAAQTPYAQDLVFGYRSSNLRNWVIEKSGGRLNSDSVHSISLAELREGGPNAVLEHLWSSRRHITIANAASYRDLEVLVLGAMRAQSEGIRICVRSAASFVRIRAGDPLPKGDLDAALGERDGGGLILIGSHVPKTTAQLEHLRKVESLNYVELIVTNLAGGRSAEEIERVSKEVRTSLDSRQTIVVYTSRATQGTPGEQSLQFGNAITNALVSIVRRLHHVPRYVIAKGGWTASEVGTRAFGVKRAYAAEPISPGVPMWTLGEETQFPGMPYVIFPGNVGDVEALASVVRRLEGR